MDRAIALLRAVNVGTGRKVAMTDLRTVFGDAGARDVQTYIQSGNVVYAHERGASDALQKDLEKRISALAGFDVAVVLRTRKQWDAVVRGNPFIDDGTKLHVAFLTADVKPSVLDTLDLPSFEPERLQLKGREIYLHLPNGMGKAKLPLALSKLKTPSTARNWNTILKLQELARS
jgi:uncharacterized protein (DUF1697 family)